MNTTAIPVSRLRLAPRSRLVARLPDFLALMKPRVMSLAVFTALVGLVIAPGRLAGSCFAGLAGSGDALLARGARGGPLREAALAPGHLSGRLAGLVRGGLCNAWTRHWPQ